MKHFYIIKDALEIKLIVLYVLKESPVPLTNAQLTHIALSSAEINFFEVYQALEFLILAGEVYTYKSMDNTIVYQLTDEGKQTASHFYMRIPLEVREYIATEMDDMFSELRKAKQLTAIPVPLGHNEFAAKCQICDNDLPLLEMSFYAGSLDNAKKICKRFKAEHSLIYDTLLSMLTADDILSNK